MDRHGAQRVIVVMLNNHARLLSGLIVLKDRLTTPDGCA